jgi:hypothetical protein
MKCIAVEFREDYTGRLFYRHWWLDAHLWLTIGGPAFEHTSEREVLPQHDLYPQLLVVSPRHFSGADVGERTGRFWALEVED